MHVTKSSIDSHRFTRYSKIATTIMVSMSAGYCVHLLGLEPSSTEVDTSVKVKVGGPKWSYHPVEFGVQYAELNL